MTGVTHLKKKKKREKKSRTLSGRKHEQLNTALKKQKQTNKQKKPESLNIPKAAGL